MLWRWSLRTREYLRVSVWPVPALAVLVAIFVAETLLDIDADTAPLGVIEGSTARDLLAAIGSGMLAFTGFVFTAVVLAAQFGSQGFSPRLLQVLRGDRVLKAALGAFVATFVYALDVLATVEEENVPELASVVAFLLLLLSVALFLALVQRTGVNLRAAALVARTGREGRRAIARIPAAAGGEPPEPEDGDVVVVRHAGAPGVVAAVDLRSLRRAARRAGAPIELVPAVGDPVAVGSPLAVAGAGVPERVVRRAVLLADERTFRQDPTFALRILVDIAIRALSPAVNDPTTAVQCLDQLDDLLRRLAPLPLGPSVVDGVVLPGPSWHDCVTLALEEIAHYGADSTQVRRRLARLAAGVAEVAPPERRAVLERYAG